MQDRDPGRTDLAYVGARGRSLWRGGVAVGGGIGAGEGPAARMGAVVPLGDEQAAYLALVQRVLSEISRWDVAGERARTVVVEVGLHARMAAPPGKAEDTRVCRGAMVAPRRCRGALGRCPASKSSKAWVWPGTKKKEIGMLFILLVRQSERAGKSREATTVDTQAPKKGEVIFPTRNVNFFQTHDGDQKSSLRQDWGQKNNHGGRKNKEARQKLCQAQWGRQSANDTH